MVETLEVDHGRSDTRKYPKSPPVGAAAYRREALADAQSTKQEEALDSPETAPLFHAGRLSVATLHLAWSLKAALAP